MRSGICDERPAAPAWLRAMFVLSADAKGPRPLPRLLHGAKHVDPRAAPGAAEMPPCGVNPGCPSGGAGLRVVAGAAEADARVGVGKAREAIKAFVKVPDRRREFAWERAFGEQRVVSRLVTVDYVWDHGPMRVR